GHAPPDLTYPLPLHERSSDLAPRLPSATGQSPPAAPPPPPPARTRAVRTRRAGAGCSCPAGAVRHFPSLSPCSADRSRRLCSSRSEEHTSELQSRENLVCRLL